MGNAVLIFGEAESKPDLPSPTRNPLHIPPSGWFRALGRMSWVTIDSDVSMRCAGVAFYSFLSIFPAVAICVLLFGLLADPALISVWIKQLEAIAPEQVVAIINDRLQALVNRPRANLGFGLFLSVFIALWSGSRGVNALLFALTRAHEAHEERGTLASVVIAVGMTVSAIFVALMMLLGVAVVPVLTAALPLPQYTEKIALWVRWPILMSLIFVALTVLYRIGPYRRDPSWRMVMPGAALATLLWLAASLLFSAYVENFGSYDAMFGSLAATVILLLWLYYSVLIVILGATFNAELEYEAQRVHAAAQ